MSEAKDGFCWCDMCGYNAKVEASDRAVVDDQCPCPLCHESAGSFLSTGDELEPHVISDEPMMTWPIVCLEVVENSGGRREHFFNVTYDSERKCYMRGGHRWGPDKFSDEAGVQGYHNCVKCGRCEPL